MLFLFVFWFLESEHVLTHFNSKILLSQHITIFVSIIVHWFATTSVIRLQQVKSESFFLVILQNFPAMGLKKTFQQVWYCPCRLIFSFDQYLICRSATSCCTQKPAPSPLRFVKSSDWFSSSLRALSRPNNDRKPLCFPPHNTYK